MYPAFEDRVVRFNQHYLSETSPEQNAFMVQTLRQRWINDPASSGYWLAVQDNQPKGHVCGWLAMDWNVPYAFIYQAEASPGFTMDWMGQLDEWVDEMNGLLIARGGCPISFIEFATFNDPESMKRLLEKAKRTNIRFRSLLRFDF